MTRSDWYAMLEASHRDDLDIDGMTDDVDLGGLASLDAEERMRAAIALVTGASASIYRSVL